jgi:raffinose/stachyose/melibiose transport system substrate-binding protein
MNMKKKLLVLLAVTLVSSMCWATGKQESIPESGKITFTGIHSYNVNNRAEDPRVDSWYTAIEKFQGEYPDAEFQFEYIPHDAYHDKAQILAAANELPDFFAVKGSWIKQFVANGRVLNLDDMLDKDPAFKDSLYMGAYKNFLVDGSIYGLSQEGGNPTHMVVYNSSILKEAGFDTFPATYNEFKELILAVKELGYTPLSMGNKGKWLSESCYLSTIGARFTGQDWTEGITNQTGSKFTDPAFIESLYILKELAEMGAFNSDMNSVEYTQQRTPYYNGEAAMFVEGFWAINDIVKNAQPDVLDATELGIWPDFGKGKGTADMVSGGAGGWATALNAKLDGEKRTLAEEFMKTFLSAETGAKLSAKGMLPGMKPGEYSTESLHRLNSDALAIAKTITPVDVYDLVWDAAVIETLNSDLQMLLIGEMSPEVLAVHVQEEYELIQ